MPTRVRKALTILAALSTVLLNVFVSYKMSSFVYLHFFFKGDDLKDLTPGDGIGMMGLWALTLIVGWAGLLLFWGAIYRQIPDSQIGNSARPSPAELDGSVKHP